MTQFTNDEIVDKLRNLLQTVDLQVATERKIRQQLEEQLGVGLEDKKDLIKEEINKFLTQDFDDKEEDDDEEIGQQSVGAEGGSELSPALADFVGQSHMGRFQVVKAIWKYIKENDLQDPKNKRNIICDDKMKTIFQPPVTMFSMNKQLSKHIYVSDKSNGIQGPKPKKSSSNTRKSSGKEKSLNSNGEPKQSGFTKPVRISPELQQILGVDYISRPEITKQMWEYFRKHNLQNPDDKREILSDETLKSLTGEDKFRAFSLQKLLKPHILTNE